MLKQLEAREDLDDGSDDAVDVEVEQQLETQLRGLQRKYSSSGGDDGEEWRGARLSTLGASLCLSKRPVPLVPCWPVGRRDRAWDQATSSGPRGGGGRGGAA
jgi:hypothetical protein